MRELIDNIKKRARWKVTTLPHIQPSFQFENENHSYKIWGDYHTWFCEPIVLSSGRMYPFRKIGKFNSQWKYHCWDIFETQVIKDITEILEIFPNVIKRFEEP